MKRPANPPTDATRAILLAAAALEVELGAAVPVEEPVATVAAEPVAVEPAEAVFEPVPAAAVPVADPEATVDPPTAAPTVCEVGKYEEIQP